MLLKRLTKEQVRFYKYWEVGNSWYKQIQGTGACKSFQGENEPLEKREAAPRQLFLQNIVKKIPLLAKDTFLSPLPMIG